MAAQPEAIKLPSLVEKNAGRLNMFNETHYQEEPIECNHSKLRSPPEVVGQYCLRTGEPRMQDRSKLPASSGVKLPTLMDKNAGRVIVPKKTSFPAEPTKCNDSELPSMEPIFLSTDTVLPSVETVASVDEIHPEESKVVTSSEPCPRKMLIDAVIRYRMLEAHKWLTVLESSAGNAANCLNGPTLDRVHRLSDRYNLISNSALKCSSDCKGRSVSGSHHMCSLDWGIRLTGRRLTTEYSLQINFAGSIPRLLSRAVAASCELDLLRYVKDYVQMAEVVEESTSPNDCIWRLQTYESTSGSRDDCIVAVGVIDNMNEVGQGEVLIDCISQGNGLQTLRGIHLPSSPPGVKRLDYLEMQYHIVPLRAGIKIKFTGATDMPPVMATCFNLMPTFILRLYMKSLFEAEAQRLRDFLTQSVELGARLDVSPRADLYKQVYSHASAIYGLQGRRGFQDVGEESCQLESF